MDLFTIDRLDNNRRNAIIEEYESLIWTDRYSRYGDLELVVKPSDEMINRLTADAWIGFTESDRVMVVKSALLENDEEGRRLLKIKGKSLEQCLEDRAAKVALNDNVWSLTGDGGPIAAAMVNRICVLGTGVSSADIIPNMTVSDLSGELNSYTFAIKEGSVYERLVEICETFDLGFRIRVTPGDPELAFEIYEGFANSNLFGGNPVSFSEELDNLTETSRLRSVAGHKNTAYVYAKNGSRTVYAEGFSGVTGLDRKVILVNAMDIDTAAGTTLNKQLDQRGRDALAEHVPVDIYDGLINTYGTYKYNSDYFLGDIVNLIEGGEISPRRVTEHIWSVDSEGLKSFPTLSQLGGV